MVFHYLMREGNSSWLEEVSGHLVHMPFILQFSFCLLICVASGCCSSWVPVQKNSVHCPQLLKVDLAALQEGGQATAAAPPRRGSHQRIRILSMDNFIDTTNIEGRFEFSEFVRAYGKYLDEQLEVFAAIKFYQARC